MLSEQGQHLLDRMLALWFETTLESVEQFCNATQEWIAWKDEKEKKLIMDMFDFVTEIDF